jgi:hypothetical protein
VGFGTGFAGPFEPTECQIAVRLGTAFWDMEMQRRPFERLFEVVGIRFRVCGVLFWVYIPAFWHIFSEIVYWFVYPRFFRSLRCEVHWC